MQNQLLGLHIISIVKGAAAGPISALGVPATCHVPLRRCESYTVIVLQLPKPPAACSVTMMMHLQGSQMRMELMTRALHATLLWCWTWQSRMPTTPLGTAASSLCPRCPDS